MAIKINEIKQTQASTETDETKDTSHLVNANKKLKTPLTSKDMSHLGRLYMTLFDRLEPNNNHNNVLELEVRQGNARHGKAKQGKAMRARGICANAFVIRLLLATHV